MDTKGSTSSGTKWYKCQCCQRDDFTTPSSRSAHIKKCRMMPQSLSANAKRRKRYHPDKQSIDSLFRIHFLNPATKTPDYGSVLNENIPRIAEILEYQPFKSLKFFLTVNIDMKKQLDSALKTSNFRTSAVIITEASDLNQKVGFMVENLVNKIDQYVREGSGWVILEVGEIHVHVTRYNPIVGSSYIKLPTAIKNKSSLVNIKNKDQKCLLWCIIAAKYPVKRNRQRVSKKYKAHVKDIVASCEWPASLKDLTKIEEENDLRLNVFGWAEREGLDKAGFFPIRHSERTQGIIINLLLLRNEQGSHYVLITSLDGLLSDKNSHAGVTYHCHRCLHGFARQVTLDKHIEDCSQFKIQRVDMPSKTHTVFKSFRKMVKVPVFVTADLECFTNEEGLHIPCGYAIKVSSHIGYDRPVEVYRGADVAQVFILRLNEVYEELEGILNSDFVISELTEDELKRHDTEDCWICQKPFSEDEVRAKDHDHCIDPLLANNYIGPARISCNIARRTDKAAKKLRVVFHNWKGLVKN